MEPGTCMIHAFRSAAAVLLLMDCPCGLPGPRPGPISNPGLRIYRKAAKHLDLWSQGHTHLPAMEDNSYSRRGLDIHRLNSPPMDASTPTTRLPYPMGQHHTKAYPLLSNRSGGTPVTSDQSVVLLLGLGTCNQVAWSLVIPR